MAIAAINFTTANGASVSSLATPSKTWTSGHLFLLWLFNHFAGTANTPTGPAGWTRHRSAGPQSSMNLHLWSFIGDGSTGTMTFDYGGQSQTLVGIVCDDFTGTAASSYVVQSVGATGSSDTPTVTVAAFADATNNACYFSFVGTFTAAHTPKAGFTELFDNNTSSRRQYSEYLVGEDLTPNATNGGNLEDWVAIGVEVAAPAAAASSTTGLIHTLNTRTPLVFT